MASKKSPNFTELEKTVLIELVDSRKGKSKSRIDYILCSNAVSSKVFGTRINHFPFSDHDIIITKLTTCVRSAQVTPIYLLIGRSGNPDLTLGYAVLR
jgi:hypothetical protein